MSNHVKRGQILDVIELFDLLKGDYQEVLIRLAVATTVEEKVKELESFFRDIKRAKTVAEDLLLPDDFKE